MSFWRSHKHEWELVGTTYAAPVDHAKGVNEHRLRVMLSGTTTFLYKCRDPQCDQFKKMECLGKLINHE